MVNTHIGSVWWSMLEGIKILEGYSGHVGKEVFIWEGNNGDQRLGSIMKVGKAAVG